MSRELIPFFDSYKENGRTKVEFCHGTLQVYDIDLKAFVLSAVLQNDWGDNCLKLQFLHAHFFKMCKFKIQQKQQWHVIYIWMGLLWDLHCYTDTYMQHASGFNVPIQSGYKTICANTDMCLFFLQQAAYHPDVSKEVQMRALRYGNESAVGYLSLLEYVLLVRLHCSQTYCFTKFLQRSGQNEQAYQIQHLMFL